MGRFGNLADQILLTTTAQNSSLPAIHAQKMAFVVPIRVPSSSSRRCRSVLTRRIRLHHGSTLNRVFRLCLDLFQPGVVRLDLLKSPLQTGQADVSEILFPNAQLELVALLEDSGGLLLGQRVGAHTQLLGDLLVLHTPPREAAG